MNNATDATQRMSRRDAIRWIMVAAGSSPFLQADAIGQMDRSAGGYGLDPDLMKGEVPWARTMNANQHKLTAVLADLILPRTGDNSPSATELKVPDFIDEWISAPYPDQQRDRKTVLGGFAWMDAEAGRRFGRNFAQLGSAEATAICDDICFLAKAAPGRAEAARFFSVFRALCLGGYYTTEVGRRDAGYVGNTPMATFGGPPPEVLARLGIERAPW